MYTIAFDAQSRTLQLKLEGFWSAATLAGFAAELISKTTALRTRYPEFAILSDSSCFPVQSPDVARGFEQLMMGGAKAHTGSTAVVVASVLNKMQAERSLPGTRVRVFMSADEARRWLATERAADGSA